MRHDRISETHKVCHHDQKDHWVITSLTNPINLSLAGKAEQASQQNRANSETPSYGDQFQAIRTVGGCKARIAQAVQEWHKTEQYEKCARNPA